MPIDICHGIKPFPVRGRELKCNIGIVMILCS